jgi:hypothetical protein
MDRSESGQRGESTGRVTEVTHALEASLVECLASVIETERHPAPRNTFLLEGAMQRLRHCVIEYTKASRAAGRLPEDVVVNLKELLREHLRDPLDGKSVAASAIAWSIESYYADDAAPPS